MTTLRRVLRHRRDYGADATLIERWRRKGGNSYLLPVVGGSVLVSVLGAGGSTSDSRGSCSLQLPFHLSQVLVNLQRLVHHIIHVLIIWNKANETKLSIIMMMIILLKTTIIILKTTTTATVDGSNRAKIFPQNENRQSARTQHLRTYVHVNKHIIYCHRNGLPRFVKRPV